MNRKDFPKMNRKDFANFAKKRPNFSDKPKKMHPKKIHQKEDLLVYGFNGLEQALLDQKILKCVYINTRSDKEKKKHILQLCKNNKVKIIFSNKNELDSIFKTSIHHGYVGVLKSSLKTIIQLEDFLKKLTTPHPFMVISDGVSDQQNVGAIIRSCKYFGVDLYIQEIHNTAPIDSITHRASAGASLTQNIYICQQLSTTIELLKSNGFLIVMAVSPSHPNAIEYEEFKTINKKTSQKIALVVGNEERGVRPHIIRFADTLLTIHGNRKANTTHKQNSIQPKKNRIDNSENGLSKSRQNFDSLNVSVATGILLAKFNLGSPVDLGKKHIRAQSVKPTPKD